jgi:hypothetical protein
MSLHDFDLNAALTKARQGIVTYTPDPSRSAIAYLPDGRHKLRLFVDPNGELIRSFMVHTVNKKRTLCPNYIKEQDLEKYKDLPECEICKLASYANDWKSGLSRRMNIMVYAHLYDTNSPSDYWQSGNTYALITRPKFRDAFIGFLEGLATDAVDYLTAMLNPSVSGGICNVEQSSGAQGAVHISSIPGVIKGPIELGDWYKPYNEVYISSDFDTASYLECLEQAKLVHADFMSKKVAVAA